MLAQAASSPNSFDNLVTMLERYFIKLGEYKSTASYAEERAKQTGEIPAHLEYYIDYEKMGRDMELGGDVFTIETAYQEVHIFAAH